MITLQQVLADIQALPDTRGLAIDQAGVKGVRYPFAVRSARVTTHTVGTFSLTVGLSGDTKGTHMSRFMELLQANREAVDCATLHLWLRDMLVRLGARSGSIDVQFPYFVNKAAPVSGVEGLLDYDVRWTATVDPQGQYRFQMRVIAPVTSLCPCSKEISRYGAHNQRSEITIDADLSEPLDIETLIGIAEQNASCEVYGLLKRPDEKFVTERAYDNPKFVEDLVRDVALALAKLPAIGAFVVEVENFESIHNHSAFARISSPGSSKRKDGITVATRGQNTKGNFTHVKPSSPH